MAKKSKKSADYFGLGRLISLILVIFPFTEWILGVVVRFKEGKYVAGIIRIFISFPVVWILDIVFMFKNKKICRILNI